MAQRSRKFGNVTQTVSINLEKGRRNRATWRRYNGFREVTRDRVAGELDELDSYLQASVRSDIAFDREVLAELKKAYDDLFGSEHPSGEMQAQVVNRELLLLKKVIADAPLSVTRMIMTRLEDLYVDVARNGFEVEPDCPNEKLEAIGRLIKLKRIQIPWSDFPIMETFMVSSNEFLDRWMK